MTTTFPAQPWTEGDTFTNDTTGVSYTYSGGKWLASGGPKVDGEFVSKKGGDEMEGPLKINNQDGLDSRAGRRIETLGVFSGSSQSALRLGTTGDRVYVGSNDTSFNGLVKIDYLEQKGSDGIKINSDTSIQKLLDITADKVEYQKNATFIGQLEAREVVNAGSLDNLMRGNDGYLAGLATEEYVDDAIGNIDIPDVDLSGYLPLTGGELTGALTIRKNTQVALEIIGDSNTSQIKFWSSGAIALQNYTAFKDNELVTKKYVDDKVAAGGGGSSFTPGDQVAKTNGTNVEVGGFYINMGNLYVRVS